MREKDVDTMPFVELSNKFYQAIATFLKSEYSNSSTMMKFIMG
jgi:hypothetical protein